MDAVRTTVSDVPSVYAVCTPGIRNRNAAFLRFTRYSVAFMCVTASYGFLDCFRVDDNTLFVQCGALSIQTKCSTVFKIKCSESTGALRSVHF